jgi:hypothetical protein
MITRKDIAAHLEKGIRTGYLLGTKDYSPRRKPFCRDVPSDGAFEAYTDMGVAPWPTQNAGKVGSGGTDGRTNAPVNGSMNAGQQVTVIGGEEQALVVYNVDWEIVIGVTHNAIDDDRAGDLETWARTAAINFEKYKDFLAFNALNNGAATTTIGPCYDGLSLFNDSHIDPNAEYQTAQDNNLALAISYANFNTARITGSKFLDGRGKPAGYNHNLLIYPPDLRDSAAQILKNPQQYGQANLNVNAYAGMVDGLEAPGGWLDTTAWFLVDTSMPQKPLNLQLRKNPELTIWDDESTGDGGVRYYKWHARGNMFPGDWRLIVQGNT